MKKSLWQTLTQNAENKLLKIPLKKRRKEVGIIAFSVIGAHLGELGNQAGPACQDLIGKLRNKLRSGEPLQSELPLDFKAADSVPHKRRLGQINQLHFL